MRKRKFRTEAFDPGAPTAERRTHDPIERVPQAIADEAGRPARPYRSVDALTAMLRKGSITPAMGADEHAQRGRIAERHLAQVEQEVDVAPVDEVRETRTQLGHR